MSDIYLLKFGGNTLNGESDLDRLAHEISELMENGRSIVVVHGGGPAISREMERLGMSPRMVAGVRVTDEGALEVAEKVLHNINGDVVAALERAGVKAVGMPAYFCTECKKKASFSAMEDGKEIIVDPGLVGEVVSVDKKTIMDLVSEKIVPVVYPIGAMAVGDKVQHLNVNADTMAAGIAAGIKCKEMIAITDVPGILRNVSNPTSKIDRVTFADIDAMIADGTISGGMIPKVEACRKAVDAGAHTVRMVNGHDPDNILTDIILNNVPKGTLIVKK